jgi:multidrug efflux pump subunit AcrA (membrane-fusion protein)
MVAAAGCQQQEQAPAAAPPKVTVGRPVQRQLTDEDEFNGRLEATESVELRARVRGHIQQVHFRDGDMVERGQLLFELDPRPFQIQVEQATAQSKSLDAQKVAADKDVARYKALVKENAASVQDYERAVFSGMLGVTIFGIFFTPVFYFVVRWFSTKRQLTPVTPRTETLSEPESSATG